MQFILRGSKHYGVSGTTPGTIAMRSRKLQRGKRRNASMVILGPVFELQRQDVSGTNQDDLCFRESICIILGIALLGHRPRPSRNRSPNAAHTGYESPRDFRRLQFLRRWSMTENTGKRFAPEVRARAVRMVFEHQGDHATQWAAIGSIAPKIGCSAETLRSWVRQAERDSGARAGLTSEERDRIRALEREVRELRQANEILRKASAYFAQAELDRPLKR